MPKYNSVYKGSEIDEAIAKVNAGTLRPYKVYTALLSQSGTDAPIATVLENTLGIDVVWTRGGAGYFTSNTNSLFTHKTICFAQRNTGDSYGREIKISRNISNQIELWQQEVVTGTLVDGFVLLQIEIRVYP